MTNFLRFWQICDNDIVLAERVIHSISLDFPHYIEQIDSAILKSQSDILYDTLHKVKGSLSYLGYKDEALIIDELSKNELSPNLQKKYQKIRIFILNLPKILAQEVNNTRQK
ncbi:MAG: hypothetical protein KC484_11300 [Colwelliaceae bacterium]|jgi:hypothetical protein|nr:hypothetical protein [Colwelliaceae bacterium]